MRIFCDKKLRLLGQQKIQNPQFFATMKVAINIQFSDINMPKFICHWLDIIEEHN